MKFATLLYIRNSNGDYLLMRRAKEPNMGLVSPPGGKLHTDEGESPAACAVREAFEECQVRSGTNDWRLMGIITEKNYPGIGNIMMFLMAFEKNCDSVPPPCNEGEFFFMRKECIFDEEIPLTDRHFIWEHVFSSENSAKPFDITIDCTKYPDLSLI